MKIFLFIGIIVTIMFSVINVMSQERKPEQKIDSPAVITQPPVPDRQSPRQHDRVDFTPENLVRLQPEEVPPALRKTLEDVKYKGWENGFLYRNIINNQYVLELPEAQESNRFYFDQNGKPLEE